jgi:hypothetical protein
MTKSLASLIFQTWADQYDREADPATVQARHNILVTWAPHLYAPMVPETFRGPKWGMR